MHMGGGLLFRRRRGKGSLALFTLEVYLANEDQRFHFRTRRQELNSVDGGKFRAATMPKVTLLTKLSQEPVPI